MIVKVEIILGAFLTDEEIDGLVLILSFNCLAMPPLSKKEMKKTPLKIRHTGLQILVVC